ncbi:type 1 glutamine amidotransferase [Tepidibacillus marianensis]|uniref:type 1 glutamine amidotransferase n=1 Tax=Tepidibacillus marianensis TaxID=3131995 RepID=UPI003865631B
MIALEKRAIWRDIQLEIRSVNSKTDLEINKADILFIGGGSDREQSLVTDELFSLKGELKVAVEDGMPMLAICGGYQFLGEYYQGIDGKKLKGLHLLDYYTISKTERLTGNVLIESDDFGKIVGYENHGGRTYHSYKALGHVMKGNGNNGVDQKEGLRYKNLIGTYLHGPILPKNTQIADFLLKIALQRKYKITTLIPLKDEIETLARDEIWRHTIHSV